MYIVWSYNDLATSIRLPEDIVCFFRFFLLSFDNVLPSILCCFAAFMSLGAVVRSCLICVCIKGWGCFGADAGIVNQAAERIGIDPKRETNEGSSGVSALTIKVNQSEDARFRSL
jgi:hypothetical protein